jgi:hypothetical protein
VTEWNTSATTRAQHLSGDGSACPIPNTHDRLFEMHYWWHEMARNYHEPDPFRYCLGAFIQVARNVTGCSRRKRRSSRTSPGITTGPRERETTLCCPGYIGLGTRLSNSKRYRPTVRSNCAALTIQGTGFDAILAPSAALEGHRTIAVFASAMRKITEERSRVGSPPSRARRLLGRVRLRRGVS